MEQQIHVTEARMDKLEDWKMIEAWNECLPVFPLIESQQTDFSEIISLR